jgi:hypothetical protein
MNTTKWLKENVNDIVFFVGLVAAVWAIYLFGKNSEITAIATTWRWILLIMVLFVILASALITRNPLFGWMINEQNRMSLSRLQMFLWTIVVLSAFVTAVFANLHFKHIETAVSIAIPEELWLAMGISITSLVGSGLILESKKDKDPKKVQLRDIKNRAGVLVTKAKPSLLDLIRGEEVSNSDKIDLTRLQNLLFTFVLVGTYMSSLSAMFVKLVTQTPEIQNIADNFPITSFPELGAGAVTLLTISHAGYLAAKAIDKQPSETTEPPGD